MSERTHIMNEQEFERLLHKVLDERQELIGLPLNTAEARAEHRKDAEFVRAWRLRWDDTARQIGTWFLRVLMAGVFVTAGVGGKKLGFW